MKCFYLFVLFSILRQQLLLRVLHRQMVKDLGIVQWITQKGHAQYKDRYFPTVKNSCVHFDVYIELKPLLCGFSLNMLINVAFICHIPKLKEIIFL